MNKQNLIDKKAKLVKSLRFILKNRAGRDSSGTVSVRHRGHRSKRYYRIIDFKRDKKDIPATVLRIEKDPYRNSLIALVKYQDGQLRYVLQSNGLKVGDKIINSEKAEIKNGNSLPLKNIPIGISVHNIELYPGQGGQMVRAAGGMATVIAKEDKYVHLKLLSGEIRKFAENCWATVGQVGNINHKDEVIGKAGRKIRMGIRPTVRGTAQNPRSHPHGGGEGRSGEGMHPKTPWGKQARGKKTRKNRIWSDFLIIQRRK